MTFEIVFEQNCESQKKNPETRARVDFLFERANILSKSQLIELAKKMFESQLFETSLDLN